MPILDKSADPRPAILHDPLPQAGDSLYDEIIEKILGKVMFWAFIAFVLAAFTALEWYRYLFHVPIILSSTITLTVITAAMATIAAIKIPLALRDIRALKLGIRGELHIAQYLEKNCRSLGYQIFHDIPAVGSGGPFNIDHALIGPAGLFSIETKNWSLPPKGTRAVIHFDPPTDTLTKPDGTFDIAAPMQAKANADYLQKLLATLTAREPKSLPTRPVLILPGWWIEDPTPRPRPIWIIPNGTLHQWLRTEPQPLTPADIAQLSETLATHIRNQKPS